MEPNSSLPCSQQHATYPYSESDKSIPLSHPIFLRFILILTSPLFLVLPSCLFPSRAPTKHLYAVLFPCVPHAPPIPIFLIWLPE